MIFGFVFKVPLSLPRLEATQYVVIQLPENAETILLCWQLPPSRGRNPHVRFKVKQFIFSSNPQSQETQVLMLCKVQPESVDK